jgi:cytochrome b involved in lipid metabolism
MSKESGPTNDYLDQPKEQLKTTNDDPTRILHVQAGGKTYDLEKFTHPGGWDRLLKYHGGSIEEAYIRVHKKPFPHEKMKEFLIDE